MNLANISPLTAKPPVGPLTMTAEQYQAKVGSMLSRVDQMELAIRGLIAEEEKQERISEIGGRIYDIAVPGRGKIREAHPVYEKIMKMRGEMSAADKEKTEKERDALHVASMLEEGYNAAPIDDEPILANFIDQSLEEGAGHFGNKTDTMDFLIDMYKKIGSNYGKREIEIKGEPAYTFDRFGLEPISQEDDPDYDMEIKDGEGHITKVETKTYDVFQNYPYVLQETYTYNWVVDTYTDEYGDEVPDDEDLGYENADLKVSYKLIRK